MLRSGVSLITALENTANTAQSSKAANDIKNIIANLRDGASFSETAERNSHIFPENALYLIRIGEETGKMDEMLKKASEHLKRIQKIISDTKQALIYPAFAFLAIAGSVLFWFYVVVPNIMEIFQEMNMDLPDITLFLLNISQFLQDHFVFMISTITLTVFTVTVLRVKSRLFRLATDSMLLKLPVVGTIISVSNMAYISEYLSLLIGAGINLLKSVSILKDSVKNEVFRSKLEVINQNLKRDRSIANSFEKASVFDTYVIQMISIGEISGNLTDQLSYVAEEYNNRLSLAVATAGKMLEPVVLVIGGTIFAIIIGGLLLPIYDLLGQIVS
jgi:type II secretory pathway component PulF